MSSLLEKLPGSQLLDEMRGGKLLTVIRDELRIESSTKEETQQHLIDSRIRTAPDPDQIRKADIFAAAEMVFTMAIAVGDAVKSKLDAGDKVNIYDKARQEFVFELIKAARSAIISNRINREKHYGPESDTVDAA